MVGFSYGGLQAAQAALDYANMDGIVDNVVLVASPISNELLEKLKRHANIAQVATMDLRTAGDALYPGISTRELPAAALSAKSDDKGTGHNYLTSGPETQSRAKLFGELLYDQLGMR